MREDPEVIGGGDANAGVTVIDAKGRMRRVGELRIQSPSRLEKLRRQEINQPFDRVGLMAVGDEQGVAGLHDDQVIHA